MHDLRSYQWEAAALRKAAAVLRSTAKEPGIPDATPEEQERAAKRCATLLRIAVSKNSAKEITE